MVLPKLLIIFFAFAVLAFRIGDGHAAALPIPDDKRGVLTIAPLLEEVAPGVVTISVKTRVAQQQNPLMSDPFFHRKTRKRYSAEEKIRIVLAGLRGAKSIAALCRRDGIAEGLNYSWSKEFLEAGKKRLAGF